MTVEELRKILMNVDDDITIQSSEGKEYVSATLFYDNNGDLCLDLE